MRKFDSYYKLLQEALPEPPPEDGEGDEGMIDLDASDQDLDVEGDDVEGPASPEADTINTPQEVELISLAMRALDYNGKVNAKIFKDFQSGADPKPILNYIEALVGRDNTLDVSEFGGVEEPLDGAEEELAPMSTEPAAGNISQRLDQYNQEDPLPDTKLNYLTRIILNAVKYKGGDHGILSSTLSPDTINFIYDKLKADFDYEVGGLTSSMIKDRNTGSSISGPGVF